MPNKTADYTLNAIRNYQNKFDSLSIRLEKGTKERIKEIYKGSINQFVCDLIYKELERLEASAEVGAAEQQKSSGDSFGECPF